MPLTQKSISKIFACITTICFFLTSLQPPAAAQSLQQLPAPGTMLNLTDIYHPAIMLGITAHPDDPLAFDFLMDTGDDNLQGDALRDESQKMINYFLTVLTVPEQEMWVNLSPYEKDRIMAEGLSQTEMGRDMLMQDYMLKQLVSSLMYPENELGSEFWSTVYETAHSKYGTIDIPTDTFNKIWIVPQKASVYIHGNNIFVSESHLKIMLEEDYLAMDMNQNRTDHGLGNVSTKDLHPLSSDMKEVMRGIIIPAIEKEVNNGRIFAPLRQMFNSLILATWYKKNLRKSLFGQAYFDQNKIEGIDLADPSIKEAVYNRYLEAFKTGAYNYIKEEYDPVTQSLTPRQYFSGGILANLASLGTTQSFKASGRTIALVSGQGEIASATSKAMLDNDMLKNALRQNLSGITEDIRNLITWSSFQAHELSSIIEWLDNANIHGIFDSRLKNQISLTQEQSGFLQQQENLSIPNTILQITLQTILNLSEIIRSIEDDSLINTINSLQEFRQQWQTENRLQSIKENPNTPQWLNPALTATITTFSELFNNLNAVLIDHWITQIPSDDSTAIPQLLTLFKDNSGIISMYPTLFPKFLSKTLPFLMKDPQSLSTALDLFQWNPHFAKDEVTALGEQLASLLINAQSVEEKKAALQILIDLKETFTPFQVAQSMQETFPFGIWNSFLKGLIPTFNEALESKKTPISQKIQILKSTETLLTFSPNGFKDYTLKSSYNYFKRTLQSIAAEKIYFSKIPFRKAKVELRALAREITGVKNNAQLVSLKNLRILITSVLFLFSAGAMAQDTKADSTQTGIAAPLDSMAIDTTGKAWAVTVAPPQAAAADSTGRPGIEPDSTRLDSAYFEWGKDTILFALKNWYKKGPDGNDIVNDVKPLKSHILTKLGMPEGTVFGIAKNPENDSAIQDDGTIHIYVEFIPSQKTYLVLKLPFTGSQQSISAGNVSLETVGDLTLIRQLLSVKPFLADMAKKNYYPVLTTLTENKKGLWIMWVFGEKWRFKDSIPGGVMSKTYFDLTSPTDPEVEPAIPGDKSDVAEAKLFRPDQLSPFQKSPFYLDVYASQAMLGENIQFRKQQDQTTNTGGIDFNTGDMLFGEDGEGLRFNFSEVDIDPAMLNNMRGIRTNITDITPLSVPQFYQLIGQAVPDNEEERAENYSRSVVFKPEDAG